MPFRVEHYANLRHAVQCAFTDSALWCEAVRAEVEVRLGPDARELAVLTDPEYSTALDIRSGLRELLRTLDRFGG
ncbi:hypothetical protein [Amycolatopsis magusensis]|uniref:hypothetical protein n=1 Tax=Amycolatopsis magusensis TaxID=882444 RepID=UPI00379BA5E2